MNALQIMNKYGTELAAIAVAITDGKANASARTEANKADTATLTGAVKAYAQATAADGIETADARKALQVALVGMDVPVGSVKASGNHFAGFRKLLETGSIDEKTNKDAQEAMESDDVKAVKAAKKALNAYAKSHKWGRDEWIGLLEREGITAADAEADADEDADEVEEQARAAA